MTDFRQVKAGFYDKSKRSVKVPVGELRVGMFVSRLDRDWLETPFLMQGFLLESQDDIDTVIDYCEHVWIDAVQPKWVPPEERGNIEGPRRKTTYINKISAQDEHRQAMGVFREARRLTKTLVDDIRLGGTINNDEAKATVKSCVDSILRNPDALLWMTKIRNQDNYTAEHCLNVCILAIAFGRHLGMSEAELEKLGLCGLLHDVGKMRIPPEVLNKPGKLTEKEWKQMSAHVIHGRNLLLASPGVANAAVDVAYSHHERMDGKGYPRKLKSAGISEFSRIISIVDAYDAMTANRCYAPAIPTTQALKIIYKDRGTHFDERLALAFIKSVGLYPPGSIVELKNGLIGLVLEGNKRYRHLPKVILLNQGSEPLQKEKIIDLAQIEAGKLSKEHLIRDTMPDGSHGIFVQEFRNKGLVFKG
ncbi:HD-GYP domain-containing protein [Gilvimarinus sp. SDUM040013]|uniref:HD-GYP domain-containing protein n=1 Tax=Gilvimarinus gilvus TaxID=3058038 RepID=A0ABU4S282_9GAMM|nr:HD-GYP domain-containing protein [Gilvimarinus sp. SDUM040013]MDO3385886.1 HD-GYP domain-containing protein [Gilvimarinus sp. SDUM040013]MDX6850611.1 HD-GYP domain-containing protein [Gilvimarinus sp. SDUM040013]